MTLETQLRFIAAILGLYGVARWFTHFDHSGLIFIIAAFGVWIVSHVKPPPNEGDSR